MDFGEILKRWEQRPRGAGRSRPRADAPRVDMGAALERFPPDAQAQAGRHEAEPRAENRAPADPDLAPQAELDLHGLSGLEAEQAIEAFVLEARDRGLSKVLLIHGKGNHSPGKPVLERLVRSFLEKCPHTGAFGKADRRLGGRGATWVRIRPKESKDYRSR
jgi:DNA-nicking Smr family endonuclease